MYRKVLDTNLFLVEAQFHKTCLDSFNMEYHNKKNKVNSNEKAKSIDLHRQAYSTVANHVKEHVIIKNEVIELNNLRNINELERLGLENGGLRADKVTSKMKSHSELSPFIAFSKVKYKGCIVSYLVYNNKITLSNAVASAYKTGISDKFQDAAVILQKVILKAFKQSTDAPWPPTADDLDKELNEHLPKELNEFINMIMGGTKDVFSSDKTERLLDRISVEQ